MGRDIEEQAAEMQQERSATIDELLTSEIGEFGRAQWLALGVSGLTFFSGTSLAMHFIEASLEPSRVSNLASPRQLSLLYAFVPPPTLQWQS
jgi:hypothetical protein